MPSPRVGASGVSQKRLLRVTSKAAALRGCEQTGELLCQGRSRCVQLSDEVHAVESVVRLAWAAGVNPVSVDWFLSRLCRDHDFRSAVSEHLLSDDDSVLRQVAGIALRAWRAIDKAKYLIRTRVYQRDE